MASILEVDDCQGHTFIQNTGSESIRSNEVNSEGISEGNSDHTSKVNMVAYQKGKHVYYHSQQQPNKRIQTTHPNFLI
ncbi:hypothetical protein RND81_04G247300 [Saponaria officinalis]|uniref:Uncharacterized protein n=1 Tax=Saponaria officinalis TaxID=3572 RepID=A0AAW1LPJ8_SAPOF